MAENEEEAVEEAPVDTRSPVLQKVSERFDDTGLLIASHDDNGDDTIVVKAGEILTVLGFLRDDPDLDFDLPMDLTVVDYLHDLDLQPYLRTLRARFEVVYHLYSVSKNHRIRVKVPLAEDELHINSATSLWIGFDWPEREAFDLYGVVFRGHHDLRRILLYDEFEGYPLRKDYPKEGRQPLIGPRN